jgi:transposase
VNARRRHFEEPLEVGLGWRGPVDLRVGVEEGEVLALQASDGSSGSLGNGTDRHDRSRVILSALSCKEARMNVRYVVTLTEAERDELKELVAKGSKLARKVKRAQVLLAADGGGSDEEIARLVVVGTSTVYRVKRRFVEEGVAAALTDRPRPGAERELSGKGSACCAPCASTAASPTGDPRARSGIWVRQRNASRARVRYFSTSTRRAESSPGPTPKPARLDLKSAA